MKTEIFQVDAFTRKVYSGNPAAVCILEKPLSSRNYLAIAREMNLSETAFVITSKEAMDSGIFELRWFTPRVEVPLCGHATLATAWVLFSEYNYHGKIHFKTLSGIHEAELVSDGVRLNFPQDKPIPVPIPEGLGEALGYSGNMRTFYGRKTAKLLVEFEQVSIIRKLKPDFKRLLSLKSDYEIRGLITTARGNGEYDIVSRYFAPWVGIDEDPVTGSAHTVLAPFWMERLGKKKIKAYQASERGGELFLEIAENNRVHIIGKAVTVMKGILFNDFA
ncbi:PhzF family phenazine biosynthesis protein [Kosmotoga pacifica]|uniref:Isomerase n=1 Tax=Kosmotoga pacifica TaxID=1330330 RepID=A0A0G2Z9L7_9BACT|nr:PhzF family phenazine biosynthesis protein [Kosmotoga pacifica]AKI98257.1 hypothetical protein IX53_04380 [Kosmotoga pacifica]